MNELFSKAEIAGRIPVGRRSGEACPNCGCLGFERVYGNFGLCQRSVLMCENGRAQEPVTKVHNAVVVALNTLEYNIAHISVSEISVPPGWDPSIIQPNASTFVFSRQLTGYSLQEWSGAVLLVKMPSAEAVSFFGKSERIFYYESVKFIQILHDDKLVRLDHK